MSSVKGLLKYSRTKKKRFKKKRADGGHSAAAARSIRNVYGSQRADLAHPPVNMFEAGADASAGFRQPPSGAALPEALMPWDLSPINKLAKVVTDAVLLDEMVRYSQLACENYGTNDNWRRLTEERLHTRVRILALEKIVNGRKHPRVAAAQCSVAEAYAENALWNQANTHANDCVATLTACGAIDGTGQLVPAAYEAFDPRTSLQMTQLLQYFKGICANAANSQDAAGTDPAVGGMHNAVSRADIVRGLVESNLLDEFDGHGGDIYTVLSGRECAEDVFCRPDDPDIDPSEKLDWIAFVEALREADVPEYTSHVQQLEDAFAVTRIAVLRRIFQRASGAASTTSDADQLELLQDFPHVDDLTLLLRGSSQARTFLQLEEICSQLETLGDVSSGLVSWELFLEACHIKQRCHFVEQSYHTALRILGESHTMHKRLEPARQAIGAAAKYLRDSVGEDHALCIPVYSALAALALVEAQTIAKRDLASATKSIKKQLESTKCRREVSEMAQQLAAQAGSGAARAQSDAWEWEEKAKKKLLSQQLAEVKADLAEDRAAKLKSALQWTYKMCNTAAKVFGKGHPETALAYAWVARLEAKAGNHHEACKMWTRCIESYNESERVDVTRASEQEGSNQESSESDALNAMTFEWDACRGVAQAHTELAVALGRLDRHENEADHLYQAALVMERIGDYEETLSLLRRWLKLRDKFDMHGGRAGDDGELDVHRKVIELTQRVHGDDCLQAAHSFKGLGLAMYRTSHPDAASVLKRAHMLYHIYFGTGHKIVRRLDTLLTKLGEKTDIFAPPGSQARGLPEGDFDSRNPLRCRPCTEACVGSLPLHLRASMQSVPLAEEYLLLAATSIQTLKPEETVDAQAIRARLNQLLQDDDDAELDSGDETDEAMTVIVQQLEDSLFDASKVSVLGLLPSRFRCTDNCLNYPAGETVHGMVC